MFVMVTAQRLRVCIDQLQRSSFFWAQIDIFSIAKETISIAARYLILL